MSEQNSPFINQCKIDQNFIFWPELAGVHYSDDVIEQLSENFNKRPTSFAI
jgi:hypothetical protein